MRNLGTTTETAAGPALRWGWYPTANGGKFTWAALPMDHLGGQDAPCPA
jgi:hypothetical protein